MRALRCFSLIFSGIAAATATEVTVPSTPPAPHSDAVPESLRQRASNGEAEAQRALGFLLLTREHRNPAEALKWLKQATAQKDMPAQGRLAHLLFWGEEGVPRNRESAVFLARPAADSGSDFAQAMMGSAYLRGIIVKRDPKAGFRYAALASAQGMLNSGHNCAICYLTGEGVEKNITQGVRLLRHTAERGHPGSRYNLGTIVFNGDYGLKQDTAEAVRLLKLAAPFEPGACFTLGEIHREGLGGASKDMVEAVRWYELGAKTGHVRCIETLATSSWLGAGTPPDRDKAIKLLTQAANLGSKDAQFTLGSMSWKGEGVPQDQVEALARFMVAAKLGHGEAAKAVDHIMAGALQLGTFAKPRAERMEKEIHPPEAC